MTPAPLLRQRLRLPLLATFEDALEDLVLTTVVDGERDRELLTCAAAAAERFGRLLSVLPPERLAAPENGPLLTLALNASSAGGNLLADLLAGPEDALAAPLDVADRDEAQAALQTFSPTPRKLEKLI